MLPKPALLATMLSLGLALPAAALASNPTWVSATGADTGTCTLDAPCATFQYAVGKTTVGGTVFVLNSGSYGPVTITKAVSIIAQPGIQAVVYVKNNGARDGILVNPGSGNVVVLKGLTVMADNANAGFFADIEVDSGRVTIEDSVLTTGNWGIYATNPDFLLIRHNHIEDTVRGIENHTNVSTIYLDSNEISLNSYALLGDFHSFGNNTMNGNSLCDICNAAITAAPFDQ